MKRLLLLLLAAIPLFGITQETIKIGVDEWMKENATLNADVIHNGTGFYSPQNAKNACPVGFRAATDEDWNTAKATLGGQSGIAQFFAVNQLAPTNGIYWNGVGIASNTTKYAYLWAIKDNGAVDVHMNASKFSIDRRVQEIGNMFYHQVKCIKEEPKPSIEYDSTLINGWWWTSPIGDFHYLEDVKCPDGWILPTRFHVDMLKDVNFSLDGYKYQCRSNRIAYKNRVAAFWLDDNKYARQYKGLYSVIDYKDSWKCLAFQLRCVKPENTKTINLVPGMNTVYSDRDTTIILK